jgi:hypothetical protein
MPIEFRIIDYGRSKALVHVFEDFSFHFVLETQKSKLNTVICIATEPPMY